MAGKLIHIFKAFLDFLFPQNCLGCGIQGVFLCDNCLNALPQCYETGFDRPKIFAATFYENDIVKNAIRRFKYHGVKSLAEPLAELIFTRCDLVNFTTRPRLVVIIPIPLSKKRLKQRGYNQAELLAKSLSDKMSIRMISNVLYKIKETLSQVEIKDKEKRLENIKGAFAVKNPEIIKDKTVILVDDIVTTGATLKEARRVLMEAGAKKVIGLVVAKG
jgi:ComF family protein